MSRNLSPRRAASLAERESRFWRNVAPILRRVESRYGASYASRSRRVIADIFADLGAASAILAAHDASKGVL